MIQPKTNSRAPKRRVLSESELEGEERLEVGIGMRICRALVGKRRDSRPIRVRIVEKVVMSNGDGDGSEDGIIMVC